MSGPQPSGSDRERNLETVRQNVKHYVARRNPEWAEDIAQDVLLVIHLRYPQLTEMADLNPVAITIARNKLFEYQRNKHKETQLDERFDTRDTESRSVEEQLIDRAAAVRLQRAISRLGDDCQRLLRMFLDGKNTADMKRILGIGDSAFYTRLCRCRQRLGVAMGWQA